MWERNGTPPMPRRHSRVVFDACETDARERQGARGARAAGANGWRCCGDGAGTIETRERGTGPTTWEGGCDRIRLEEEGRTEGVARTAATSVGARGPAVREGRRAARTRSASGRGRTTRTCRTRVLARLGPGRTKRLPWYASPGAFCAASGARQSRDASRAHRRIIR